MFGISTIQLLIVGLVAVLLFGGRLPSVARSIGKSLTEFKKGMRDVEEDVRSSVYSEPAGRVGHTPTPSAPQSPPAPAPQETADAAN